jgi:Domain of unknown function (DUF5092)
MTIIGDVHYYTIKHSDASKILGQQNNSPLRIFTDLFGDQRQDKLKQELVTKPPINLVQRLKTKVSPTRVTLTISKDAFEDYDSPKSSVNLLDKKSGRRSFDDAYTDTKQRDQRDVSPHTHSSDRHRTVRSHAFANERTESMTPDRWVKLHSRSAVSSPTKKSSGIFFEAHYYACDDDYLMKMEIRTYFKQNALESTDAILFSIVNGHEVPSNHPALENFGTSGISVVI